MLKKLDWREVTIHFFIPMAVMSVLLAMLFSGVRLFETIIAMPYLERVALPSRRELGLLENLQNLLIIVTLVVTVRSAIRHKQLATRAIFGVIAAVTTFMLLEEMDYGLHYYELIVGVPPEEAATVRNLHNQGISTPLKSTGDLLLILGFVVAPLALARVRQPWIQYLTPDRYFLLTMLCGLITSRIGHTFEDSVAHISFDKNIGEFRETVTYYIAMLYVMKLSRRTPPNAPPEGSVETTSEDAG